MESDKFKAKLSSNVLEMKFMKKSKEKCEREAEEEKRKILFESELNSCIIKGSNACTMEPSFVPCLQLLTGRFSFKGMNPEIEKLMIQNEAKDMNKLKKMGGVSDKEMAERYTTLMGAIKKKFITKRKWAVENNDVEDIFCYSIPEQNKHLHKKLLKFKKPRE